MTYEPPSSSGGSSHDYDEPNDEDGIILYMNPEVDGYCDFNSILRDCSPNNNSSKLKHVMMYLPQEYLLPPREGDDEEEEDGNSSTAAASPGTCILKDEISMVVEAATTSSSVPLKLSPMVLEKFLKDQKHHLVSFEFKVAGGDSSCWDQVARMTHSGRAFLPLARIKTLEKLVFANVAFPNVADLTILIRSHPKLKELQLHQIILGHSGSGSGSSSCWPRGACEELSSAISQCTGLIKLSISQHHLNDGDIYEILATTSPNEGGGAAGVLEDLNMLNLRSLCLEGTSFAAGGDDLKGGGNHLTDRGFRTIARMCPNLQALNLNYHHRATTNGIQTILQHCLHLRELNICRVGTSAEGELDRSIAAIRTSAMIHTIITSSLTNNSKLLLCTVGGGGGGGDDENNNDSNNEDDNDDSDDDDAVTTSTTTTKSLLEEAILATHGHLLFCTDSNGLIEPPSAPLAQRRRRHSCSNSSFVSTTTTTSSSTTTITIQCCKRNYDQRKQLVDQAMDKLDDPMIYNEWEDLF